MGYTTPIKDRTIQDVINRASKAHFNISDWTRILNNAKLVNGLIEALTNTSVDFFMIFYNPTTRTIADFLQFNGLFRNIEEIRQIANIENVAGVKTPVKYDYIGGNFTFNYVIANYIEFLLDAIWLHYNGSSFTVFPVLSANLTISSLSIYVDGIDAANFNIEIQGNSKLYII